MLLFRDSDTHSNKGYMQVTLDQPFYEPGATVTGTIYMRVMQPIFNARGISLEVKGGGKNGFTRFWHETETHGETTTVVERHEKMKHAKKFLNYKQLVWMSPQQIMPGDYTIGFNFLLPNKLPSSFMFKGKKHDREAPKAKVKYFAKAVLDCEGEDMKHKSVLIIREKATSAKSDISLSETSEIKTWGCCAQGTSKLEAKFNKNVFTPAEDAEGDLMIDNSNCKVKVKEVKFAIEQVLKQKVGHHTHTERKTIIKKEISGPDANEGNWTKKMKLDLSKIKYDVASEKKKKGKKGAKKDEL